MSRIGKVPVPVPAGVDVRIEQGVVKVKGPKGQMELDTRGHVGVEMQDGNVLVSRPNDEKQSRAFHGLYQRLMGSMIHGVTQGFKKDLEIQGVGYRASMDGATLVCALGYSHPVRFQPPAGITLACPDQTHISVSGIDKQLVGQVAANIREFRPPEPYKGKGIRYVGEKVRRKVGKSGVK